MGNFAVIVATCEHKNRMKWGKTKAGTPRLRCKDCGKMLTESTEQLNGLRIGLDRAAQVIDAACVKAPRFGPLAGLRASARTLSLICCTFIGPKCDDYMREHIKDVFVDSVQVDEIWGFVFCKAATAKRMKYVGGCGDAYCYTAIDSARRSYLSLGTWAGAMSSTRTHFITKLERATTGHFHISSDGWKSYPSTIKRNLGHRVDHGIMNKIYGRAINYPISAYSPARIIGAYKTPMHGDVYQQDKICTSHVERHNMHNSHVLLSE